MVNGLVSYRYAELTKENEIGQSYSFKKKLFTKGSVGAVYDCKLSEEGSVNFNKKEHPSYFILDGEIHNSVFSKFKELQTFKERDRQVGNHLKLSKADKSESELEINNLRSVYQSLPIRKREFFITNLVYQITK